MAVYGGPDIVTDGLVLCLDAANEKSYPGSGNVWTDLSGNGNNGTLLNGVGYNSNNMGSLVFDGVNDYVSIDKTVSQMNVLDASLTISALFYRPTIAGSTLRGYLGFNTLSIKNSVNIFLDVTSSLGTRYIITIASGIPSDIWTHMSFSVNNNIIKTYFNGLLSNTVSINSNIASIQNSNLSFGSGYGYFMYNGFISQVLMYNKILTDSEILQNYNATKGRYGL